MRICIQCKQLQTERHFKETKHHILLLGTHESKHKVYSAHEYLASQVFHGKKGKYERSVLDLDPLEGTRVSDLPSAPPGARPSSSSSSSQKNTRTARGRHARKRARIGRKGGLS